MSVILRKLLEINKKKVFTQHIACLQSSTNGISNCNLAVSEAEKVVGYPTSFLNLRWLLSDEIANVAFHLTKLMGTNHPLLQTAKQVYYSLSVYFFLFIVFYRDLLLNNATPSWGLVILLVSKAGGLKKSFSEIEHDNTAGILHSQRALAEVTEMIRTSHRLHKSLLNYDSPSKNSKDLNYGNKIALLSGDYLLSSSYNELANLKNQELNELMSSALRDLAECEFIGDRDEQNKPLPSRPIITEKNIEIASEVGTEALNSVEALGNAKAEWTLRNILGGASLLGKSCQGALMLSGHSDFAQRDAYLFGKHLALAWQAYFDKELFVDNKSGRFSLVSGPVLFHLQYEPEDYGLIEKAGRNAENVDFEKLRKLVLNGPGIEKTGELQKEHSEVALQMLEGFQVEDATIALRNIINSMQD